MAACPTRPGWSLCIDVSDPRSAMAPFWAAAVGGRASDPRDETDPGDVARHPARAAASRCARSPEERTVKQRVHLDVHTARRPAARRRRRAVLREPDETGFAGRCWRTRRAASSARSCARRLADYRLYEVIVSTPSTPEPIARWWADRFGVEAQHDGRRPLVVLEGCPGCAVREHRVRAGPGAQDGEEPHPLGRLRRRGRLPGRRGAPVCGTRRGGRCSRIPRATSSACSPREVGAQAVRARWWT